MPVMSGWEFLERFDSLDESIKKRISIFILSSSVDSRDKARSYANKNVRDHLTKPITNKVILEVVKS
jgi:CheY-like chemotaxis protein